ncbi:hypothetical protein FQN51_006493 [Onygenales sp. PD_10]|nr:hypothetical protein FQN51_006493 [Onygenales sp. PD_10]
MDAPTNHPATPPSPSRHQLPLTIRPVRSTTDLATTISLFKTYTNALGIDLSYQDFDTELACMPGAYAPPYGELLLAVRKRDTPHSNDNDNDNDNDKDEEVLGCIALRPLYLTPNPTSTLTSTSTPTPPSTSTSISSQTPTPPPTTHSELKRLYVTPPARGLGVGGALVNAMLTVTREKGYGEVYLDTLKSMRAAVGLYRGMGFEEIEKYYEGAREGTVFLRLRL